MRNMLTLYEHPFALYCQKVLVALNEQGVAYEVLEEQRDFDRSELAELWPPASIPVLRDGDQIIGESSIIIEYVAGARLVPSLQARRWDRVCDQYISDAVQAIVADTIQERGDQRAVARARGRLDMAYGMLETQLTQHEFLAGETFTVADCAAAPGLFYAGPTSTATTDIPNGRADRDRTGPSGRLAWPPTGVLRGATTYLARMAERSGKPRLAQITIERAGCLAPLRDGAVSPSTPA